MPAKTRQKLSTIAMGRQSPRKGHKARPRTTLEKARTAYTNMQKIQTQNLYCKLSTKARFMGLQALIEQKNDIAYPMCSTPALENYDYGKQDWLVSIKYDGVRAFCQSKQISKRGIESCLFGRSLKAIPNKNIQKVFCEYLHLLHGFDGEITHKECKGNDAMAKASGVAMSIDSPLANFVFRVFNYFGNGSEAYCSLPYTERMQDAKNCIAKLPYSIKQHFHIVEQIPVISIVEAKAFAEKAELDGYEGAILTIANAPYLQRRVLPKSPFGIKLKSIASAEAVITSFEPEIYSAGKTVPKELWGQAKEAVGAIHCKAPGYEPFRIGTGFSKAQAEAMWANQADYIGKVLTFEYMLVGSRDRPRQPRFKGMRAEADIAPETMEALKNASKY